jgi:hypothetical protein
MENDEAADALVHSLEQNKDQYKKPLYLVTVVGYHLLISFYPAQQIFNLRTNWLCFFTSKLPVALSSFILESRTSRKPKKLLLLKISRWQSIEHR